MSSNRNEYPSFYNTNRANSGEQVNANTANVPLGAQSHSNDVVEEVFESVSEAKTEEPISPKHDIDDLTSRPSSSSIPIRVPEDLNRSEASNHKHQTSPNFARFKKELYNMRMREEVIYKVITDYKNQEKMYYDFYIRSRITIPLTPSDDNFFNVIGHLHMAIMRLQGILLRRKIFLASLMKLMQEKRTRNLELFRLFNEMTNIP